MKTFGTICAALALIAIAPAHAFGTKKSSETGSCPAFKELNKHVIFIDNTAPSGGNGSCKRPYNSLQIAEENSNPGDVLYVIATKKAYELDSTLTLQNSQALIGSSIGLKLDGKQVSALTPNQQPKLKVNLTTGPGIAVANCNQIAGFAIVGTGDWNVGIGNDPSTPGVGNQCYISGNSFKNLEEGIALVIQSRSAIDIDENHFSNISTSIALKLNEGAVGNVYKNHFEKVETGIRAERLSISKAAYPSVAEPIEKLIRNKKPFYLSAKTGDSSCDNGSYRLSVKKNEFKNVGDELNSRAIYAFAGELLELSDNAVFNFREGFFANAVQHLDVFRNSFQGITSSNRAQDVPVSMFKNNIFSGNGNNEASLVLVLARGTVCAEGNTFKNNAKYGLNALLISPNLTSLHLVDNRGESNGIADFALQDTEGDPALFQIVVPEATPDGKESLSEANHDAEVLILDLYGNSYDSVVSYIVLP